MWLKMIWRVGAIMPAQPGEQIAERKKRMNVGLEVAI
jgi:hypothetical protein